MITSSIAWFLCKHFRFKVNRKNKIGLFGKISSITFVMFCSVLIWFWMPDFQKTFFAILHWNHCNLSRLGFDCHWTKVNLSFFVKLKRKSKKTDSVVWLAAALMQVFSSLPVLCTPMFSQSAQILSFVIPNTYKIVYYKMIFSLLSAYNSIKRNAGYSFWYRLHMNSFVSS